MSDPILQAIVEHLRLQYGCHTVILYGSRARGEETPGSDYDVAGIRPRGPKTREAAKVRGAYWDLFIYSEPDLRRFSQQQWAWKDARLLWQEGDYGRRLLKRLERFWQRPFEPAPQSEIEATRAWSGKQLERCQRGDVHGWYRRGELQVAALADYFQLRKLRYPGPKAGLQWLQLNDPESYGRFAGVYENPGDFAALEALEALVERVYGCEGEARGKDT